MEMLKSFAIPIIVLLLLNFIIRTQIMVAKLLINFFEKFKDNRTKSIVSGVLFVISEIILVMLYNYIIKLIKGGF